MYFAVHPYFLCCLQHLPFQFSIFVLAPQLPGIHHILPDDIRTRGDGGGGIKKCYREPQPNHRILLPQRLTATDTFSITTAHSLSDRKEQEGNPQGQQQQQQHGVA